jgi:hypothetical protein
MIFGRGAGLEIGNLITFDPALILTPARFFRLDPIQQLTPAALAHYHLAPLDHALVPTLHT